MSSIVAKELLEQKLIDIASNGDTTMSAVKPMEQMLARGVKTETLAAVVQYHCPMTDKPITKVHAPPTGKKKTVCYLVNKAVSFTGGGVANHDGYVLTMDGFSPNGSTYDGTAIGIGTTVTSGALVPIPATQYRGNCINLYYKIGSSPVIDLLHPLTTGWTAMTDLSLGTGDLIPNTSAYRVLGMAVKMTDDTDLMYRGGEVRGAKFDLEETEGQYRSQPTPSFDFQQAAKAYDRQASGEGLSQGEFFKYDVPKVEEKDPSPQTAGDYYRQTRIITGMATDGNNVVNHPTYKTGRSEDGFYAIATASDRNWSRMESWTAQPTFACNSSPQSNGTTGWYTPASHNDGFDQTVLQVYNLNTNYKHTINAVYFVESEVDPNSVMVKLSHDEATQDVFFTQVCSEVASVLEPFYPASFNDGGTVFKFIMKAIEAVGNAVSFIPHPLVSAIGTGAAAAAKAIRQGTERTVAVVRQEPQREPRLLAPNAPASVRILSVTQPNHRAEVVHELQNLRMKQAKKRVNVAGVRPPPLPPRPGQARAGFKRKAKAKRPNVRVFPGKPKGG